MDYVIVGGGVYGCGVAWELARHGAEVMVLEAVQIAAGASGGVGKRGVRANGRDRRELPLMQIAYERWPTLHEELEHETGYERIGHLQIIERQRDMAGNTARAWMQAQQGIESQVLTAGAVRELEPFISEEVLGAIYCPLDGIADHTATTEGFAVAAQRKGAVIEEGCTVTAIETDGDRVVAVHCGDERRIPITKALILLANSAVSQLLQQTFQITLPVWSRLPQIVLTEPIAPMPLQHLIGHAHRRLAMKALPNNQVMISGGWLGKWDEQTQRGLTQPDQITGNLAEATALYPALANVGVVTASADRLETECADGIPIIDKVAGVENLFYGVGWSGHGWAIAPTVTRLLAEWVQQDKQPELLAPFAYQRFHRKSFVR